MNTPLTRGCTIFGKSIWVIEQISKGDQWKHIYITYLHIYVSASMVVVEIYCIWLQIMSYQILTDCNYVALGTWCHHLLKGRIDWFDCFAQHIWFYCWLFPEHIDWFDCFLSTLIDWMIWMIWSIWLISPAEDLWKAGTEWLGSEECAAEDFFQKRFLF